MSMTLLECAQALLPIGHLYNFAPDRLSAYARPIHSAVESFHIDDLKATVQQLVLTAGHYPPKPAEYLTALRRLKKLRDTPKARDPNAPPSCTVCGDTLRVPAYCIRAADGYNTTLLKPCPACRQQDHDHYSPPFGWTQVTEQAWHEHDGPEAAARFNHRKELIQQLRQQGLSNDDIINTIFRRALRSNRMVSLAELVGLGNSTILPTTEDPPGDSE